MLLFNIYIDFFNFFDVNILLKLFQNNDILRNFEIFYVSIILACLSVIPKEHYQICKTHIIVGIQTVAKEQHTIFLVLKQQFSHYEY